MICGARESAAGERSDAEAAELTRLVKGVTRYRDRELRSIKRLPEKRNKKRQASLKHLAAEMKGSSLAAAVESHLKKG